MIERKIISQKLKEFQIQDYISSTLKNSGQSHTKLLHTPLGEKIVVYTSRPGIIVGRKGQHIKKLTSAIKKRFELENPQLEIAEVENVNLNAKIVAERIAQSFERYGSQRFKGIVHRVMQDSITAKAMGIEVTISGKVPSARAKAWRFYLGYLKKCGDIALTGVDRGFATAKLKSGIIGIKVRIMPPTTKLPDDIHVATASELELLTQELKEVKSGVPGSHSESQETAGNEEGKKEEKTAKKPRKRASKKKESPEPQGVQASQAQPQTPSPTLAAQDVELEETPDEN
ncbi:MAG: small subunit ribosomal protein S3 [archaeon GW2011_AR16]|nr:30S ribosomal protein S3 [uncultured archaeon]AJS12094.1 small subunit ribosomal protein S3 [uncultured archaeon]KHO51182.1 MAG: small subunit ribosomal protein S3 [archaeon GW2011_AR16]HIH46799.1 30S ribosomal protein S3 [Candidatus Woesearchaeota archaeon]